MSFLFSSGLFGPAIPDSGTNQWYIDEGSGSTLNPDVGSVTATTSGGATWVSDTSAVGDYHLSHDGGDDIWQTDSGVLTTPFSVGGWVRFDSIGNNDQAVAWNNSDNSAGERWRINDWNSDGLMVVQGGGSIFGSSQPFPSAGNWGFFAANVQSDQSRLITFSNSQELSDNTAGHNNNGLGSAKTLVVGRDGGGRYFGGDSDFYVVSEGTLLSKTEWTELWEATQR